MKTLDLHSKIALRRAISPVSVGDNTAQVGQIIDRQGFSALEFGILTGSLADADATFTVLVEHGDDPALADAAAVPDVELLGTEAGAGFQFDDDNETRKIGYAGNRRYVRLTITPAGNAGGALIGAAAILGGAESSPVA
jgi:hypothetical protein